MTKSWMLLGALLAACDGTTEPRASAELRVADITLEARGDTATLTALLDDVVAAAEWESLDPSIASVSEAGLATGVAAGSARVRARFGGAEATGKVTVLPPVAVRVSDVAVVTDPNGQPGLRMRIRNLGGRGFYALELWKLDPDGSKRRILWYTTETEVEPGLDVMHTNYLADEVADWVVVHSREPLADEPVRTACVRVDGAAGCPSDLPDPPAVSSVLITPAGAVLEVGDSTLLRARAYDAGGAEITGRAVAWRTTSPAVLHVDEGGTVRALAPGYGQVEATVDGVTGAVALTVTEPEPEPEPEPVVERLEIYAVGILFTGETVRFVGRAIDAQGVPLDDVVVQWSSGDSAVVEASGDGTMLARAPGGTVVRASAAGQHVDITVRVTGAPDAELVLSTLPTVGHPQLNRLALGVSSGTGFIHHGPGLRQPAASPDGTRIVFVMDTPEGSADLFVVNADGSDLRRLTTNPGPDDQPAWSPDGRSIAFRSGVDGLVDVWVIEADGTGLRNLTDLGGIRFGGESAVRPAWSPDGQWVAYAWGDQNATPARMSIRVIRRDGSETRTITALSGYEDTEPSFSPSGYQIAFRRNGNGVQNRIVIADLSGNLIDPGAGLGSGRTPRWSPDGEWLAYVRPHSTVDTAGEVVLKRIGWEVERVLAGASDVDWIKVR